MRIFILTLLLVMSITPSCPALEKPGFCIFNGVTGLPESMESISKAISQSRVVLVGETHDQANDHLVQLEVLEMLHKVKNRKTVVGLEMLNMKLQPLLDLYAGGEISEEKFLKKSDWKKEWGFPFELYKPIFDYIRRHNLKAIALNVPKRLVARVARAGMEGLAPEEKKDLPENMELSSDQRYIKHLKKVFSEHSARNGPRNGRKRAVPPPAAKKMPRMTWKHYSQSMMLWNEVMAENTSAYLKQSTRTAMLVLAGNGHLMYNAGISSGIARRLPGVRQTNFYIMGKSSAGTDSQPARRLRGSCPDTLGHDSLGLADYIWIVPHSHKNQ